MASIPPIPPGLFDFHHPALKWTPGSYGKKQFLSTVFPYDRLSDFVTAENQRNKCEFYENGGGRNKKAIQGQQIRKGACLERTVYHCNYGPEDHRDKKAAAEVKQEGRRFKPAAQGKGLKRGCQATFTARQLSAQPHLVEIRYSLDQHSGHGDDAKGPGLHHTNAHISDRLRKFVEAQVQLGVPVHQIVKQNQDAYLHDFMVRNGLVDREAALKALLASKPVRDFYLSNKDVENIQATVHSREWRRHPNQQHSVELWVQQHQDEVLLHQRQTPLPGTPDYEYMARVSPVSPVNHASTAAPPFISASANAEEVPLAANQHSKGPDTNDGKNHRETSKKAAAGFQCNPDNWLPFHLGFMRDSGVEMALRYGKKGIQMDSTFATNDHRFPLFTLLVVDEWNNGIPVAFFFCSREVTESIAAFLDAFKSKVQSRDPDWDPAFFLMDCAPAESSAVHMVFGPDKRIFFCHWHVQKAWQKQLAAKVRVRKGTQKGQEDRRRRIKVIFADLLALMRFNPHVDNPEDAPGLVKAQYEAFCQKHAAEKDFIAYFRSEWGHKLDRIVQLFRTLAGCEINTTSHIEGYHGSLKGRHLVVKQRLNSRRLDWTLHVIYSQVSLEYVHKHEIKQLGLQRNKTAYDAVNSAILAARKVPNAAVTVSGIGCAFVASGSGEAKRYSVSSAAEGHAQPSCSCIAGKVGKLCWHVVKLLIIRGATEAMLLDCLGTYFGSDFGGYGALYREMAAAELAQQEAQEAAKEEEAAAQDADDARHGQVADGDDTVLPSDGNVKAAVGSAANAGADNGCNSEDGAVDALSSGESLAAFSQQVDLQFASLAQLDKEWGTLRHEVAECSGEARQHVLHVLRQTINSVRRSNARGALQQVAAAQHLAVMLPNPDADLTENSLVRKRDFLDRSRKGCKTAPIAAPNVPAFLKPSIGKRKLSPWMEISAVADSESEDAAQADHLSAKSARSESHQPQCFADITNTVAAQPGGTCREVSRLRLVSALQLSSDSSALHTVDSAAAVTKECPTDGGQRRPQRERREPAALLDYSQ